MQLNIITRKPTLGFPLTLDLEGKDLTIDALITTIHKRLPNYPPQRQRLTLGSRLFPWPFVVKNHGLDNKQVLSLGKTLDFYNIKDGDSLIFKDLGPQIGWRTVFIIEYLGPLLIHPFFYLNQRLIYQSDFQHSNMQQLAFWLIMLHFLKREFESIFVHHFSLSYMPLRNLFKNSAHYHILSGFLIAYFTYGPWFDATSDKAIRSNLYSTVLVLLWTWAEFSNGLVHWTLRNLRAKDDGNANKRKIPYGYGFSWLSCPNYFFESVAWLSFALLTWHWSAWLFLLVSYVQMHQWALKKHRRYLSTFPDYPRNRKAILPFLI